MARFGDMYGKYYDLLYKDKDYKKEVEYIDNLIKKYTKKTTTILDLGCGTGLHDQLLCAKDYEVLGIDMSEAMLKKAYRRADNIKNLAFKKENILSLDLQKKFDVVVSLFHVLSYQNSNEDVIKMFNNAKKHLKIGGVFIFDFWYGPAVLTELPTTRVKRLDDKDICITRIAEPFLYSRKNVVDVKYDIFIKNKQTKQIIQKQELHPMRYFFDTELENICKQVGLKVLQKYKWLKMKKPDFNSWNVVWVVKK